MKPIPQGFLLFNCFQGRCHVNSVDFWIENQVYQQREQHGQPCCKDKRIQRNRSGKHDNIYFRHRNDKSCQEYTTDQSKQNANGHREKVFPIDIGGTLAIVQASTFTVASSRIRSVMLIFERL